LATGFVGGDLVGRRLGRAGLSPRTTLSRWRADIRLHRLRSIKQDDAQAAIVAARRGGTKLTIEASIDAVTAWLGETSLLNAWRVPPSVRTVVMRLQFHRSGSNALRVVALEPLPEERFVGTPPPDVRSPNELDAIRTRLVVEIGEPLPGFRENSRDHCAQILARYRPNLCQAVRPSSSKLLTEERTWAPDLQAAGVVLRRWRANLRISWLPRVAERLAGCGDDLVDNIGLHLEAGGSIERQLRQHWSLRDCDPRSEALLEHGFVDNANLARAIRQTKLMARSTAGEHTNA